MKKTLTVILTIVLVFSILSLTVFANGESASDSGENIFASIYSVIIKNSDKILSAFAALASVLLALLYKRGLLPILKGSISKLNATVSSLREENAKALQDTREDMLASKNTLEEAERVFRSLESRLSSLEQTLTLSAEEQAERKNLKSVVITQIDMLYEVFMSSSLPAYLKESIAERIGEMKREIKDTSLDKSSKYASDKETEDA